MWFRDHAALTLASVYVVLLGVVAVVWERFFAPAPPRRAQAATRIADTSAVYALGALAWPFVWSAVCGAAMPSMPSIGYVGVLWPPTLLLVDALYARHTAAHDAQKQTYAMQLDGNTLSGLALTLGGLLVRWVSDKFATSASPMFTAAVLLALLVVFPSPAMHAESREANAVRAAQKVALQYCLGLLLTAVSIAFGVGMQHTDEQCNALAHAMTTPPPEAEA